MFPVIGSRMEDMEADGSKILVVDDEPNISDLLATSLRFVGFRVEVAARGLEALAKAVSYRPDLMLVDIMLPDVDGFEVCRRLRADGNNVPVLFITARDTPSDKVRGLTLGGDDYVTKPFSLEEVVARVRALLRRSGAPSLRPQGPLKFIDIEMDEDAHEVSRHGEPIELSPTEFNLLRYLIINAGRVLSKSQILDHVWQYDFDGDGSIVETYISYLRKKIDRNREPLIHTIRGVGYTMKKK